MAYGNYAPFYRGGYFNPAQGPTMPQYQPLQDGGINYQPPYQNALQGNLQPQSDFLWVLNENEATAYPVAPNNSVVLWDKNSPTIYVKSVSAQGIPSMRVLDFTERTTSSQAPRVQGEQFVTVEAFKALQGELEAVKGTLAKMKEKTEVETDE